MVLALSKDASAICIGGISILKSKKNLSALVAVYVFLKPKKEVEL